MLKLTVIRYPCIKGVHAAFCVLQCLRVVEQLCTLHSEGFCHGDVRLANIVFSESALASNADGATSASTTSLQAPSAQRTKPTANLIDFDLCALENSYYSDRYQWVIGVDGQRHKDAQAKQTMKKSHNWFALATAFGFHCLASNSRRSGPGPCKTSRTAISTLRSSTCPPSRIASYRCPKSTRWVDSINKATDYTP